MVNGIVRSPASFFDTTPSAVLISKFSNDLGILDNSLPFTLAYLFEGPITVLAAMVNICQIYPYFIPAAVSMLAISVIFFSYSQPAITQTK
jgi:hypothetical protein